MNLYTIVCSSNDMGTYLQQQCMYVCEMSVYLCLINLEFALRLRVWTYIVYITFLLANA